MPSHPPSVQAESQAPAGCRLHRNPGRKTEKGDRLERGTGTPPHDRKRGRRLYRSELLTKIRGAFSAYSLLFGRESASRLAIPPAPRLLRSRSPRGPQLFYQLLLLVRGQF